jgi:GAF domain-containing protein
MFNLNSDPRLALDNLRLRFSQSAVAIALILLIIQYLNYQFNATNGAPEVVPFFVLPTIVILAVGLIVLLQNVFVEQTINIILIGLIVVNLNLTGDVVRLGSGALLLLGSALFARSWVYYPSVLVVCGITVIRQLQSSSTQTLFNTVIPYIALLVIFSILLRVFRNRIYGFADNARHTTDLLSASSTIGQTIGQFTELNQLLSRSVDVVRDRLSFYHVQIFLITPANTIKLEASTGDIGKKLVASMQTFPANTQNPVGRCIQSGSAQVINDLSSRASYMFGDVLLNTVSELVVPILDGERIIGVLDIHSMRRNAFSQTDVQAMEIIANQLATGIRNSRLFDSQEQTIRENKRLFLESETNLREIERLNRQMSKQAWENYMGGQGIVSGVSLTNQEFRPGADWSELMTQAAQRRRSISKAIPETNRHIIAVPIELRGEILGAIELETNENVILSDTMDMLQAISQRLAISVDNARLFEETQETTAQEQRINEIVSGYQMAQSMEELLQITLEGLTEALGAEAGSIRLGHNLSLDDSTKPASLNGDNNHA